ncbi:hypothetical protein RQP46_007392 [Phenoliferia psychrophenolica]
MSGTTDALAPVALPELSASPSSTSSAEEDKMTEKAAAPRAGINFPDEDEAAPHRPSGIGLPRVGTKELRLNRELTRDEKDLANAGYQKEPLKTEAKNVDIIEQHLTPEALATKMGASINLKAPAESLGLTSAEAAKRLITNGANVLTPPVKKGAWRKYFDSLTSLFNLLLILCGVLEYVLLGVDYKANFANTYLGAILIAVAFLNAGIEYYQVAKSEAILASFLALIPPACTVVRDGQISTIPAQGLVHGDVVLIRMGDKTPADLYLFAAGSLKVDNSSLTGESEPQERMAVMDGDSAKAAEAKNLVFNSTLVVSGEGWGVVVRTGDHTFIGQIANLTGNESGKKSPLAEEIESFVKKISALAIGSAILFFIIGIASVYKGRAASTVTFAITILVAFVPEGLPATVTLLLSIAAKRMAARQVLVKDLQGVETLGAITLLATDKTGTLTRNQMTVSNVWTGNVMYTDFQANNDDDEAKPLSIAATNMTTIIDVCALNSKIKFNRTDIPFSQREVLGDATETGLTRFAAKYVPGGDYDACRAASPVVHSVPFNSETKTALVIIEKVHPNGSLTLLIKGAPERVLERCITYLDANGLDHPLDDAFKVSYDAAYDYMASRGHRCIATAQLLLPASEYPVGFEFVKAPFDGYTFVGLVSLEDPPKHGVREAIGTLRLAGIQVAMVTGDHPKTAEAIARKINLITGETKADVAKRTGRAIDTIDEDEYDAVVIHGDSIDALEGWEWDQIFRHTEIVFARTSPKHKLEIVKHAQQLGHIVGVTGDGVNDSPALKRADLGIAMNISGSDVSKEAANMLLLDDNFASIVHGVQEGRLIFANLKRSIRYTVTHSIPEVIPQLLYILVPVPLPLSALLILVIDLGFELFVALTFAFDPPESADAIMSLPPRKPVTERSIQSIKSKALHRIKTQAIDPETGAPKKPSFLSRWATKLKAPFTKAWWAEAFEESDGEVLVDNSLLSYSYLEAGVIEMLGALVAYFVVFYESGFSPNDLRLAQKAQNANPPILYFLSDSPNYTNSAGRVLSASDQVDAWAKAQSIMYLSIFIIQCFNIFACKAKFLPPFGKQVINNPYNFAGIVGGAVLAMFIIYTPPLHTVFGGTYKLSPLYWLIPVGFGFVLLGWSTIRVYITRRRLNSERVKPVKGLNMYATMYSQRSATRSAKA